VRREIGAIFHHGEITFRYHCFYCSLSLIHCSYGITKLLQIYATRELASLLPVSEYGVVMNTVSPGLCNTDLDRNAPLMFRLNLWFMRMVMGRTAEMGSRTLLHALFAGKESHGEYLRSCEIKG
jgi:NAD(P)-dependent dehydrogenase (short-subunit alcohol dehydrogenase family)